MPANKDRLEQGWPHVSSPSSSWGKGVCSTAALPKTSQAQQTSKLLLALPGDPRSGGWEGQLVGQGRSQLSRHLPRAHGCGFQISTGAWLLIVWLPGPLRHSQNKLRTSLSKETSEASTGGRVQLTDSSSQGHLLPHQLRVSIKGVCSPDSSPRGRRMPFVCVWGGGVFWGI